VATFSQRQDTKERKELPAAGPQNQAAGRRKDEAGMEMLRRPYLPAFRAPAAGFPTGRDFGRLWRPSRGIGISLRSTTGARRAPLRSGERKSRTYALTLPSPFLRQGFLLRQDYGGQVGGQAGGRGESGIPTGRDAPAVLPPKASSATLGLPAGEGKWAHAVRPYVRANARVARAPSPCPLPSFAKATEGRPGGEGKCTGGSRSRSGSGGPVAHLRVPGGSGSGLWFSLRGLPLFRARAPAPQRRRTAPISTLPGAAR